jgi:hypothetical protein
MLFFILNKINQKMVLNLKIEIQNNQLSKVE